jgi:hypothetical protein
MGMSLQRHCADEAAQHHGRVLAGIVAHLHQEAPALIGTIVALNASFVFQRWAKKVPCLSTQYSCTASESRR